MTSYHFILVLPHVPLQKGEPRGQVCSASLFGWGVKCGGTGAFPRACHQSGLLPCCRPDLLWHGQGSRKTGSLGSLECLLFSQQAAWILRGRKIPSLPQSGIHTWLHIGRETHLHDHMHAPTPDLHLHRCEHTHTPTALPTCTGRAAPWYLQALTHLYTHAL